MASEKWDPSAPRKYELFPEKWGDKDELETRLRRVLVALPDDVTGLLPPQMSPSRANEFKTCPRSFFFQTIAKIETPASFASLRGGIIHRCNELVLDSPPGERTPEKGISFIPRAWKEIHDPDVRDLSPADAERKLRSAAAALACISLGSDDEQELFTAAEEGIANWFEIEQVDKLNPFDLPLPDGSVIPDGREIHLEGTVAGVKVHGYADRLEHFTEVVPTAQGPKSLDRFVIGDYKSGDKVPWEKNPKWRADTIERIKFEAFFQLLIYALAAWEQYQIRVEWVRLIYTGVAEVVDDDGNVVKTRREQGLRQLRVTPDVVARTRALISKLSRGMRKEARGYNVTDPVTQQSRPARHHEKWRGNVGPLCGHCYFAAVCPEFTAHQEQVAAYEAAQPGHSTERHDVPVELPAAA